MRLPNTHKQYLPIQGKNAVEVADALITYFSCFGTPEQIVVDGGLEFNNDVIKELLNKHKIKLHICTPHNPNSNSNIERLHSTLIEYMRILRTKDTQSTIGKLMRIAIIGYNNSIHSVLGMTPHNITFGHTKSRDPFDLYYDRGFYNDYIEKHANRLKNV